LARILAYVARREALDKVANEKLQVVVLVQDASVRAIIEWDLLLKDVLGIGLKVRRLGWVGINGS
jgi:hypothetical protein